MISIVLGVISLFLIVYLASEKRWCYRGPVPLYVPLFLISIAGGLRELYWTTITKRPTISELSDLSDMITSGNFEGTYEVINSDN